MKRMTASRNIVLIIFMISTFAIGMTEYVVTGLLTQFSSDLHVSVSTTGLLLSVYAIGVATFGPLLRIVTIKLAPKPLLIGLMGIFICSNVMAATAANFEVLLLSRLFSAAMHAPFFGLCMSIAYNISPPEKGTSAIAAVQGGLTIAIMLGVPFGSYLGGILDWRYVFWFIVFLGVLAFIGLIAYTPDLKPGTPPNVKTELRIFKNKHVLLVLAIIICGYSGAFTAYTFIEPMLREYAGFGITGITTAFFCFGLGAVIGNFMSGEIRTGLLTKRLAFSLAILALTLAAFTFVIRIAPLALVMSFLFGAGTFGTATILNSKIIIGGKEAPSLSGTIAASAFNLANSIGATLGTFLLHGEVSYMWITIIAACMMVVGMTLSVITKKVEDLSYS